MTGLETIRREILDEASARAEELLAQARREADKTVAAAEKAAEAEVQTLLDSAALKRADFRRAAADEAALARRRALLEVRREEVEKTVAAARQAILDLPDSEYFALLSRQIGALGAESGELRLSARDLGRLPRDFEKSLPEGIALSKESAPIDGGFLLLQNGIEINNSLSALFDAARDSLSDLAAEALFS